MNKIQCEKRMKKMGIWYDMLIANDGYYFNMYPIKDKHWFPLIGVHSNCVDTRGEFDQRPKRKVVWESVWYTLDDDLYPEYCGCIDCCAHDE